MIDKILIFSFLACIAKQATAADSENNRIGQFVLTASPFNSGGHGTLYSTSYQGAVGGGYFFTKNDRVSIYSRIYTNENDEAFDNNLSIDKSKFPKLLNTKKSIHVGYSRYVLIGEQISVFHGPFYSYSIQENRRQTQSGSTGDESYYVFEKSKNTTQSISYVFGAEYFFTDRFSTSLSFAIYFSQTKSKNNYETVGTTSDSLREDDTSKSTTQFLGFDYLWFNIYI